MALTQGLADFRGFHNCKEAFTENISLVTRVGMGEGAPVPVMCSGVGWLPPSRSARSPVTQPSPCWPGARPPREGLPSQTQTACIAVPMFRACLLCLIAGLCLNPLQGEELSTIQNGVTIVS